MPSSTIAFQAFFLALAWGSHHYQRSAAPVPRRRASAWASGGSSHLNIEHAWGRGLGKVFAGTGLEQGCNRSALVPPRSMASIGRRRRRLTIQLEELLVARLRGQLLGVGNGLLEGVALWWGHVCCWGSKVIGANLAKGELLQLGTKVLRCGSWISRAKGCEGPWPC